MKDRVAHSKPGDFSLGQIYEFIGAFGRHGGTAQLLQTLTEDKRRIEQVLRIAQGTYLPCGYELAKIVLGDDFIAPEEMRKKYPFDHPPEQLEHFKNTLPSLDTLIWLHINQFVLIPGPMEDCSLLGVRSLQRHLFKVPDYGHGWFTSIDSTFSRTDIVRAGTWLMLRKTEVPNSRNKGWKKQNTLVTSPQYVPNAAEVAYGITVYKMICNKNLLADYWVRTASQSAHGDHVCIGRFNERGLDVEVSSNGDKTELLGIASALKNHQT